MNLYDLIKRQDQWLEIAGDVRLTEPRINGIRHRAVYLSAGSSIRLRNAHEIFALNHEPVGSLWHAYAVKSEATIRVQANQKDRHPTYLAIVRNIPPLSDDRLNSAEVWVKPPDRITEEFDLELRCDGGDAILIIGPFQSMIQKVTAALSGQGVELGPGLNPQIKPSPNITVSYIEQTPPHEWSNLYNQNIPPSLTQELQNLYKIDSAAAPIDVQDSSLDFVFSNHVCEHFSNFGQVLMNWADKLRLGGRFCGVVPDCRYSFDYRQSPTELAEIIALLRKGGYEITDDAYERWCTKTEPRHKAEDLKARGYSIHISYFTPASLSNILQYFCSIGAYSSFSIWCIANGRDIGFSMQR